MNDDPRPPERRRGEEPERPPRRRRRPRELWETETEPFPGALALWDLEDAPADDAATVLARFSVLRCLAAVTAGRRAAGRHARRAAKGYLDVTPEAAARPLRRLLGRRRAAPAPLYRALVDAGLQAAERGHAGGAYALLRWAYEVAMVAGKSRPAARVAACMTRLAAEDDAPYSARRWTVRVHALVGDDGVPGPLVRSYVAGMKPNEEAKGGGYDADARRRLAASIAAGTPAMCPVCNAPVSMTEVRPPEGVSYVRRRVWVLCTGCRRTAALDDPGRAGGGV